ncbi:MAG: cellulase, partial [Acidobacteria bacterium]
MRTRLVALTLAALTPSWAHAQNPPVTVAVDAAANRHAISPLVYGVHFAPTATLQDLNATVNRYGGNSSGRYNWLENIDNRGGDYFFESIPYPDPAQGELGDTFISTTKAGGAEPFLTMPMVGWVARTNAFRDTLCSFSVAKYPGQTGADGDCGSGCLAGPDTYPCQTGTPFLAADPTDASIPADGAFQQNWMAHIKGVFGPASLGGLRYWGLDNEPTIWHNVYWDVHPLPADTDEMRAKMIDYGSRIKSVDPTAQVLGPEEWGWDAYFYSGKDQQLLSQVACNGPDCPDRLAQGGLDYTAYLLDQLHQYEAGGGGRILDMLTEHFYPQTGEFSPDTSPATQDLRNRSTRGLWDPNYVNESFINDTVRLIPRMKDWVDTYYPGTKIGLTEYDWGADNHINGATAEADLLGIFGREGLDMALKWNPPVLGSPVAKAFQMYRNYDGAKSTFGDTSVSATSAANPDNLAAFAAERTSDSALTVMVVNKQRVGSITTTVNLANYAATGNVEVWQLTSANSITHVTDFAYAGGTFSRSLPPQTVTLFVVHGSGGGPATADLAISKTDGQTTASPSQSVTYAIVASNAGPGDANGA